MPRVSLASRSPRLRPARMRTLARAQARRVANCHQLARVQAAVRSAWVRSVVNCDRDRGLCSSRGPVLARAHARLGRRVARVQNATFARIWSPAHPALQRVERLRCLARIQLRAFACGCTRRRRLVLPALALGTLQPPKARHRDDEGLQPHAPPARPVMGSVRRNFIGSNLHLPGPYSL